MENKENKQKFVSVTTQRNKTAACDEFSGVFFGDNNLDNVLNSTAQSHVDFKYSDIHSLSSIHGFSAVNDLTTIFSGDVQSTLKQEPHTEEAISADPNVNQTELDCLYLDYLLSLFKIETRKKCFREEEEVMMKDVYDVHLASEALKKEIFDLDIKEKYLDGLIELAKSHKILSDFLNQNADSLRHFEANYQKLSEMCKKVKRFLIIRNIFISDKTKFDESLRTELKSSTELMEKLINQEKIESLPNAPDMQQHEMVNYKLIEQVFQKFEQMRNALTEVLSLAL